MMANVTPNTQVDPRAAAQQGSAPDATAVAPQAQGTAAAQAGAATETARVVFRDLASI